jgi:hypothetical protein
MNSSTVKSFGKKLACPSSNLLLMFRSQRLAPEISLLVINHLATCDFCYCEISLLSFYTVPVRDETRTPALPINLKVLAEAILCGKKPVAGQGVVRGRAFAKTNPEDSAC